MEDNKFLLILIHENVFKLKINLYFVLAKNNRRGSITKPKELLKFY